MNRPALFLDRDGVINIDHGYVHTPEKFEFVHGIFEVVAAASRMGYLVVVVTNQAGIGRGYYTEAQFHELTDWMKARFMEHGGRIDAVYFCPYHPEHGIGSYLQKSDYRKPAPGMLLLAEQELKIDMKRSLIIGDKPSDMEAGRAAGIGCLLYLSDKADEKESWQIIGNLFEALPYLRALSN